MELFKLFVDDFNGFLNAFFGCFFMGVCRFLLLWIWMEMKVIGFCLSFTVIVVWWVLLHCIYVYGFVVVDVDWSLLCNHRNHDWFTVFVPSIGFNGTSIWMVGLNRSLNLTMDQRTQLNARTSFSKSGFRRFNISLFLLSRKGSPSSLQSGKMHGHLYTLTQPHFKINQNTRPPKHHITGRFEKPCEDMPRYIKIC